MKLLAWINECAVYSQKNTGKYAVLDTKTNLAYIFFDKTLLEDIESVFRDNSKISLKNLKGV